MIFRNPSASGISPSAEVGDAVAAFHRRLPGYRPTPLHEVATLPGLPPAVSLRVKDESDRLGLPAFKILGASWAAWRALRDRIGAELEGWSDIEDLARRVSRHRPLELVAATAGNHGRAVARTARWLELPARIFLPHDAAAHRVASIEQEGARAIRVDGDYDVAVSEAESVRDPGAILLQDTSRPEDERVASWVIDGYATLGRELDRQLGRTASDGDREARPPDIVFVPMGVGSLATAIVRHFKSPSRDRQPVVVGVEPDDSACVLEALRRGAIRPLSGTRNTMMAGLACGLMASVAWPTLRDGLDAVVTISDARAAESMRTLAERGIVAGESGAAGLGGLLELADAPARIRSAMGLRPGSEVLTIVTEGATDPERYRRIVGG